MRLLSDAVAPFSLAVLPGAVVNGVGICALLGYRCDWVHRLDGLAAGLILPLAVGIPLAIMGVAAASRATPDRRRTTLFAAGSALVLNAIIFGCLMLIAFLSLSLDPEG